VPWLAPRPSGPFRALTERVYQAFPAFPPYEGQFADVIPHLTVGQGHALDDLHAAEESIQPYLPIHAHATPVTLITEQTAGGPWIKATTFTLPYD
jgi:2'-5' RNA ligase superfamily